MVKRTALKTSHTLRRLIVAVGILMLGVLTSLPFRQETPPVPEVSDVPAQFHETILHRPGIPFDLAIKSQMEGETVPTRPTFRLPPTRRDQVDQRVTIGSPATVPVPRIADEYPGRQ